jgi:hypothetical protein
LTTKNQKNLSISENLTVWPSLETFVGEKAKSQLGIDCATRVNKNCRFGFWSDPRHGDMSGQFETHKSGDFRSGVE